MIDQARLDAIHLHTRPFGQRLFGTLFLTPNYSFPGRRTRIVLEGADNLPSGGAVLVMNHTDRYNYWPFQYQLWREKRGYTATWVKGKYFESRALGWFMDACNNIPLPSRGYVLSKDFQLALQRAPRDEEYAALKQLTDGAIDEATTRARGGPEVAAFLDRGWPDAPTGRYADSFAARFAAMMHRVVEICREGLATGLFLLVFPQGTRSKRLTRGHTGAAQIALHTGVPVIPIGANGSDKLYPGNSPWSRGGTVTYRIGAPLAPDGELRRFAIPEPFQPFTPEAEKHDATFRALTDLLMDRINDLLDPEYQYAEDETGERGANRFL